MSSSSDQEAPDAGASSYPFPASSWASAGLSTPAVQGPLVRTLQHDLIPRLARAHRPNLAQLTARDVDSFTLELLQDGEAVLLARLEALRQRGFTIEALCMDLLAPSARRLGALWNDDRCDFASVTIGVSLLQRLMRRIGRNWVPSLDYPGPGYSVLLLQSPQEQHNFGLAMVGEFFRCAGWAVAGGVSDADAMAARQAQARHFDVVGFSVGSEAQLEWLRVQIASVRLTSRNAQVVIMLGGPLFLEHPTWAPQLGADLCVASGRDAPGLAERLVRAQNV